MADKEHDKPDEKNALKDVRALDFAPRYANNVRFEGSVWDLRMMFGTLDQAENIVGLHTSINIPWTQAKLMLYYLYVHVQFHEEGNGRIRVPSTVVPTPVGKAIPSLADDPRGASLLQRTERMREELFGREKADDDQAP